MSCEGHSRTNNCGNAGMESKERATKCKNQKAHIASNKIGQFQRDVSILQLDVKMYEKLILFDFVILPFPVFVMKIVP